MTVQLREGSEVRTFANAAAALKDLMEREGSPYVSGVRSADGASITVTDGTGRVATFGLSEFDEFDEDSKVVTSEPILDEGGCPIKLGDEVRIGAYR